MGTCVAPFSTTHKPTAPGIKRSNSNGLSKTLTIIALAAARAMWNLSNRYKPQRSIESAHFDYTYC